MKTLTKILGSGAFALALAVPSCRDDIAYTPEIPKATQVEKYTPREQLTERLDNPEYIATLDDFKLALGDRYQPEREEELKNFTKDQEMLQGFCEIYTDLEGVINKIPPKNALNLKCGIVEVHYMNSKRLENIDNQIPWDLSSKDVDKMTESDKAIIYGMTLLHPEI